ncbi:hypothetical protein KEM54_002906 [Ascosphaera aggregata]|nr:hypothetical protein KEM54_002906 [Ascosphaera aggregata]
MSEEKDSNSDLKDEISNLNITVIPLDSPIRTTPIHPLLQEIKIPDNDDPDRMKSEENKKNATRIDDSEISSLSASYPTPIAIQKGIDEAAEEVRRLLDEREEKERTIEKEMKRKTEEREVERRVYEREKERRMRMKSRSREEEEEKNE